MLVPYSCLCNNGRESRQGSSIKENNYPFPAFCKTWKNMEAYTYFILYRSIKAENSLYFIFKARVLLKRHWWYTTDKDCCTTMRAV